MQLGILGGTFDPVHYGHLRFAEEARELFQLDGVIFIPVGIPPHKAASKITPAEQRLAMVELAIKGNRSLCTSDIEVKRPWMSYSVETIEEIKGQFGDGADLFFLVGYDAFKDIGTWKDHQKLLSLCHFVVARRAGQGGGLPLEVASLFCYHEAKGCYLHSSGHSLHMVQVTALDISSTQIRGAVQSGRSISYLVSPEVEEFIRRDGLYRK